MCQENIHLQKGTQSSEHNLWLHEQTKEMAALTTTTVAMVQPSEKKPHQYKTGKRGKLTFLATFFFKDNSCKDIATTVHYLT